MAIEPKSIALPPGVVALPTRKTNSANWQETNLMRWVGGKLSPIGGWSRLDYPGFASPLRYMHRWTTNGGANIVAYLCEQHVYVDMGDGVLRDISPTSPLEPPANSIAGGYGDYQYNYGDYGTPRPDREVIEVIPDVFHLDNWGENLLIMSSADGRLLMWDPNDAGVVAAPVENAPVDNRTFVVTPQRYVILFAVGGVFNKFQWCNEEDITNWTVASTTTKGGFLTIQPAAHIVAVVRSGPDVLVFTSSNSGYIISFVGLPYVYSLTQFQSEAMPLSPRALASLPSGAVWAASDGLWQLSGLVAVPVPCPVWSWVDDLIDEQVARVTSDFVIISSYSEVYFFFPSRDSNVNDRYIVWNYRENWWATGKMVRSCGVKSSYTGYPLMSDGVSVYRHEYGTAYSLLPEEEVPWARTHVINIAGGALLSTVGRMIPDIEGDTSALLFSMDYNIERDGSRQPYNSGDKKVVDGIVGFRDSGRDFRLTIKHGDTLYREWTMGDNLLEVVPRGRK